MTATTSAASGRYRDRLTLRVPLGLPQAIEAAATRQLTSPAEYVRRALLGALNADGIRLEADGKFHIGQSVQGQAA
jgi:hypothetical protein